MGKDSGPGAKDRVGSLFSLRPLFWSSVKIKYKNACWGGGGGWPALMGATDIINIEDISSAS